MREQKIYTSLLSPHVIPLWLSYRDTLGNISLIITRPHPVITINGIALPNNKPAARYV
ncbi:MAG: hypothetical protein V4660_19585 [Pseudomonadota bacterium]